MKSAKRVAIYFVLGAICAFGINFSFSFRDPHLTFFIAFLLTILAGFLGQPRIKWKLWYLGGFLAYFIVGIIIARWVMQIGLVLLTALASVGMGFIIRHYLKKDKVFSWIVSIGMIAGSSSLLYFGIGSMTLSMARLESPPMPAIAEISLTEPTGESLAIRDLAGTHKVVGLWHIRCGSCKPMLKKLEELQSAFAPNDEVAFYAVNIGYDTFEVAQAHIQESMTELSLHFLHDRSQSIRKLLNVRTAPVILLLDERNKIISAIQGYNNTTGRMLRRHLAGLIEDD